MERWIASVAPDCANVAKSFALGHRRGASRGAGQHQRLRDFRQSEFALQRRARRREGRDAGRHRIRNVARVEAAHLLSDRAPDRKIARMQPRHVETGVMRLLHLSDDIVERQRRRVDDARVRRTMRQHAGRHQRAGVKAHRTSRDEIAPAQSEQIGGAGTGADEMHGHELSSSPRFARAHAAKASSRAARQDGCSRRRRRARRLRRRCRRRTSPARAANASPPDALRARNCRERQKDEFKPKFARRLVESDFLRLAFERAKSRIAQIDAMRLRDAAHEFDDILRGNPTSRAEAEGICRVHLFVARHCVTAIAGSSA